LAQGIPRTFATNSKNKSSTLRLVARVDPERSVARRPRQIAPRLLLLFALPSASHIAVGHYTSTGS
jgi:hypothetical protein